MKAGTESEKTVDIREKIETGKKTEGRDTTDWTQQQG